MKHFLKWFTLTFLLTMPTVYAYDEQAKQASLEIIGAISDDIAELIINNRHEKDPQVAKARSISLITRIADIIAMIVAHIKVRKTTTRGIELFNEEEYAQALDAIIKKLLSKIDAIE